MKYELKQQDELDKMVLVYDRHAGNIEVVTKRELIMIKNLIETLDDFSNFTIEQMLKRSR